MGYQDVVRAGKCWRCRKSRDGNGNLCSSCRSKVHEEVKAKCDARLLDGLCIDCGLPSVPGKRRCEDDLKRTRTYAQDRKNKRKANGVCVYCGTCPPLSGIDQCLRCKLASVEKSSRGRTGGYVAISDLWKLWECQAGCCAFTGIPLNPVGQDETSVALDHITPLSCGGLHEISNLRFVAHRVNQMKGSMSPVEFERVVNREALASYLRQSIGGELPSEISCPL